MVSPTLDHGKGTDLKTSKSRPPVLMRLSSPRAPLGCFASEVMNEDWRRGRAQSPEGHHLEVSPAGP